MALFEMRMSYLVMDFKEVSAALAKLCCILDPF